MFSFLFFAMVFLSVPAFAQTPEEQFSQMDVNKDGFLSEKEFVDGMQKKSASTDDSLETLQKLSDPEKKELIRLIVTQLKEQLPYKVDEITVWTDIYAQDEEMHYVYQVDIPEIDTLPAEEQGTFMTYFKDQVCKISVPLVCRFTNDALLKYGIQLITHYKDKSGKELASCQITSKDCQ